MDKRFVKGTRDTSRRTIAVLFSLFVLLTTFGGCDCDNPTKVVPILPPDYYYDDNPTWSRAGDRVTFSRSTDSTGTWLEVTDTITGEPQKLAPGSFQAQWLPGDSEFIFFSGFKLYKMHFPGMQISTICDCEFSRFPELDPTGRYLYYEDVGASDGWGMSVYRMDLETGDTVHIIGGGYPSVSPDGDYLLVNRHDSVLRYDLDNMTLLSGVTADAQVYDWTADGQNIVYGFFYNKQRAGKLFISNADGSNFRYLAVGNWPSCAPNSNRIAISRRGTDNKPYIWLIDQQGGNAKQITF